EASLGSVLRKTLPTLSTWVVSRPRLRAVSEISLGSGLDAALVLSTTGDAAMVAPAIPSAANNSGGIEKSLSALITSTATPTLEAAAVISAGSTTSVQITI